MTSLKLYTVNKDFYDYLAKYDNKLMAISEGKDRRPMVGIVLEVGDFKYLAPLSSYKPHKHARMKNTIDFMKIEDMAVINFNNMFPVLESKIMVIDLTHEQDKKYRDLLAKELEWLNANKYRIFKTAGALYRKIAKFPDCAIANRCCNFNLLEEKVGQYSIQEYAKSLGLDIN